MSRKPNFAELPPDILNIITEKIGNVKKSDTLWSWASSSPDMFRSYQRVKRSRATRAGHARLAALEREERAVKKHVLGTYLHKMKLTRVDHILFTRVTYIVNRLQDIARDIMASRNMRFQASLRRRTNMRDKIVNTFKKQLLARHDDLSNEAYDRMMFRTPWGDDVFFSLDYSHNGAVQLSADARPYARDALSVALSVAALPTLPTSLQLRSYAKRKFSAVRLAKLYAFIKRTMPGVDVYVRDLPDWFKAANGMNAQILYEGAYGNGAPNYANARYDTNTSRSTSRSASSNSNSNSNFW